MQTLIRGQKIKLSDLSDSTQIQIGISINAKKSLVLDISCFGVDAQNKLSDDRYFVFYNQKTSPCNSILSLGSKNGDQERFQIDLSRLPATVNRLVFVVTIDGNGVMSEISESYLRLLNDSEELVRFTFSGIDFKDEKAIMIADFYFKDGWRFSANGQGFNGGLNTLLKHFGGEEKSSEIPSEIAKLNKENLKTVLLEKRLEKEAPNLVKLAKKLTVSLQKKQLQDTVAKVVIAIDASGSMARSYQNGAIQSLLDKITLVAARLDDDGNLETWFYAEKCSRLPDITIQNVSNYLVTQKVYFASGVNSESSVVTGNFFQRMSKDWKLNTEWHNKVGGCWNNEIPVMQAIFSNHKSSELPVLVIFITDGGISNKKTNEIKKILIRASNYPIFWQFIGLAGSNYGLLEELDEMDGRTVDNANFFQVDDLAIIDDEELYSKLLNEFPIWLKEAKKKGINFG